MPTPKFSPSKMLAHTSEYISALKELKESSFKPTHSFKIDCNDLNQPNSRIEDFCEACPQVKNIYSTLIEIENPVLYWFEIKSGNSSRDIYNALKAYKDTRQKNTPALKKNLPDWSSTVLYVGKRKNKFDGRVTQHLGLYEKASTQGLQLCHWANNLNLELELNVHCIA